VPIMPIMLAKDLRELAGFPREVKERDLPS
jgi:hypothetical protein